MLRFYTPDLPQSWHWIRFSGPDAQDFLQRLTTVDTRLLRTDRGQPGCFLNPQGKIRATFMLWRLGEGQYAFELAGGRENHWTNALTKVIDEFHFGEKFELNPDTEHACVWLLTDPTEEYTSEDFFPQEGAPKILHLASPSGKPILMAYQGIKKYGRPWFTAWGEKGALAEWQSELSKNLKCAPLMWNELEELRVQAVYPSVDCELENPDKPEFNPLEIGMSDAISDQKGCYPGQEVIEKIISLGSPAMRLCQIEIQNPTPSSQTLKTRDKLLNQATPPMEIGKVTSAGNSNLALAMVRKIQAVLGQTLTTPNGGSALIRKIAPHEIHT